MWAFGLRSTSHCRQVSPRVVSLLGVFAQAGKTCVPFHAFAFTLTRVI